MENAEKAIMMAFAVFVLVIALSLAMYLFSKVTVTSEQLAFYSDSTIYYDNVELTKKCSTCNKDNPVNSEICEFCKTPFPENGETSDDDIKYGTVRIVSAETIIPTLYRYYKENFCVKIYGAADGTGKRDLIQIFDVNLEGKVHSAAGDTQATETATSPTHIQNFAYNQTFNKEKDNANQKIKYCLFGAPWLGSTEAVKTRVDFFVNGKSGYINNSYVDYRGNEFYKARTELKADGTVHQFKERFISYSYTGQTMVTEDGEELVTGEKSKDKIVIIYTLID